MNYFNRIKTIQKNFLAGFADRETSLSLFEDLLHEYGLLPIEDQLDRTITNENFIGMLRMAARHKDVQSNPEVSNDAGVGTKSEFSKETESMLEKYGKDLERISNLMGLPRDQYRIADSILQTCPVCHAKAAGLYNRMQGLDNQIIPVDPPRCQKCMVKWIEEKFGLGTHSNIAAPPPSVSVDDSIVKPLDAAEIDFFKILEAQMEDFKP